MREEPMDETEFVNLNGIEIFWVEGELQAFAIDIDGRVEYLGPTTLDPRAA